MDVSKIRTADQLPFPVPDILAESIARLLRAMEEDDPWVDDWFMDVEGMARCLPEEQDMWVREFYCRGGYWRDIDAG